MKKTQFNPMSIYALGKVSAYHLCKMYNQIYGMFNCGESFTIITSQEELGICNKKNCSSSL